MNWFGRTSLLVIFLFSVGACTSGPHTPATVEQQHAGNGDCEKKLQTVGSAGAAKPTQSGVGDSIDHDGPCGGPSAAEQLQRRGRIEQHRFGLDYMDEG